MLGKYLKDFCSSFLSGQFWLESENLKQKIEVKIKESKNISAPFGYIECQLQNTTIEDLHQKYNILLKSLNIEDKIFVQSLILLNEPKEFDCYADGENIFIEIKEIDNNLLAIKVKEKSGTEEKFYIRGGKIEIKL